jgi:hypothetical protein
MIFSLFWSVVLRRKTVKTGGGPSQKNSASLSFSIFNSNYYGFEVEEDNNNMASVDEELASKKERILEEAPNNKSTATLTLQSRLRVVTLTSYAISMILRIVYCFLMWFGSSSSNFQPPPPSIWCAVVLAVRRRLGA